MLCIKQFNGRSNYNWYTGLTRYQPCFPSSNAMFKKMCPFHFIKIPYILTDIYGMGPTDNQKSPYIVYTNYGNL